MFHPTNGYQTPSKALTHLCFDKGWQGAKTLGGYFRYMFKILGHNEGQGWASLLTFSSAGFALAPQGLF
ncbi:unnamed protein product [Gadus morhua 'NCC']